MDPAVLHDHVTDFLNNKYTLSNAGVDTAGCEGK